MKAHQKDYFSKIILITNSLVLNIVEHLSHHLEKYSLVDHHIDKSSLVDWTALHYYSQEER
jgi:hypothetical protein